MEACDVKQGPSQEDNRCAFYVQTFCNVPGQTVKDNSINKLLYNNNPDFGKLMSDGVELPQIKEDETISTAKIWNRIYKVLKNIYNYGALGTRNPQVYAPGVFIDQSKVYTNGIDGDWTRPDENSQNKNWLFKLKNGTYATGWFVVKGEGYKNGQIYYAEYISSKDTINTNHGHIYSGEKKIGDKWYSFNDSNGYLEQGVYRQAAPTWDNTKVSYYDDGGVYQADYVGKAWNRQHNRTPIYEEDALKDVIAIEDKMLAKQYNDILTKLSLATNSNKVTKQVTKFTKEQIDKLQTLINDYELNDTRCNVCNSNCNALCQRNSQGSAGSNCGAYNPPIIASVCGNTTSEFFGFGGTCHPQTTSDVCLGAYTMGAASY